MNIYDEIEKVIDKYYNEQDNFINRTREGSNEDIHYIEEEIEHALEEELECFDVRVSVVECFECPSMEVFALSWCCLYEGDLYNDIFAVYNR